MPIVLTRIYKCMLCGTLTTVTKYDVNRCVRCKKCNSMHVWLEEKYYGAKK